MGNMIITNSYEPIFVVDGASGTRPTNALPSTGEETGFYYVLIGSMMLVGILVQRFSVVKYKGK